MPMSMWKVTGYTEMKCVGYNAVFDNDETLKSKACKKN
jgi:hypothetical protein